MLELIIALFLAVALAFSSEAGRYSALGDIWRDSRKANSIYSMITYRGYVVIGLQKFDKERYEGVSAGKNYNQRFPWTADFWHAMKWNMNACFWMSGMFSAFAFLLIGISKQEEIHAFATIKEASFFLLQIIVLFVLLFLLQWAVFGARFIWEYHYNLRIIPKGNFWHYIRNLLDLKDDKLSNQ